MPYAPGKVPGCGADMVEVALDVDRRRGASPRCTPANPTGDALGLGGGAAEQPLGSGVTQVVIQSLGRQSRVLYVADFSCLQ